MFLARNLASRPVSRCHCEAPSNSSSNGVVTVATKGPEQEVQISKTINALDALLGEEAKPKAAPAPPKAPSPPSTSSSSQAGVFSWPSGTSTPAPKTTNAAARKTQQTFASVMSFEGLAPEVINGRAAMLGFLAAFSTEIASGESVYSQLISGGGLKMLAVIAAVSLASFAPAIRQIPLDEVFNRNPKKMRGVGPFAADAELINGRAAMIGLATMIILEGTSGTAFFL